MIKKVDVANQSSEKLIYDDDSNFYVYIICKKSLREQILRGLINKLLLYYIFIILIILSIVKA